MIKLNSLPRSADVALLVLRLWLGLSLLLLHGWGKLVGFSGMASKFPDPLGVSPKISLGLAIFAEVLCSALLAIGLFSRLATAALTITMATAFFLVHKAALTGPNGGELAFVYLAGFVALLVAGPGRFSLDERLWGRAGR